MITRIVTYIPLLILCLNSYAQYNGELYNDATIYTADDSINCLIITSEYYAGRIKYRTSNKSRKIHYIQAEDIIKISTPTATFNRVENAKGSFLMQSIASGYISAYKHLSHRKGSSLYNPGINSTYYMSISGEYHYYLKKGNNLIEIKKRGLKKDLKTLFKEADFLYPQIRRLRYNDLMFDAQLHELLYSYNIWHDEKYGFISKDN